MVMLSSKGAREKMKRKIKNKITLCSKAIELLIEYSCEINMLGNECAYTDRILEQLMTTVDKITSDYKKIADTKS